MMFPALSLYISLMFPALYLSELASEIAFISWYEKEANWYFNGPKYGWVELKERLTDLLQPCHIWLGETEEEAGVPNNRI